MNSVVHVNTEPVATPVVVQPPPDSPSIFLSLTGGKNKKSPRKKEREGEEVREGGEPQLLEDLPATWPELENSAEEASATISSEPAPPLTGEQLPENKNKEEGDDSVGSEQTKSVINQSDNLTQYMETQTIPGLSEQTNSEADENESELDQSLQRVKSGQPTETVSPDENHATANVSQQETRSDTLSQSETGGEALETARQSHNHGEDEQLPEAPRDEL